MNYADLTWIEQRRATLAQTQGWTDFVRENPKQVPRDAIERHYYLLGWQQAKDKLARRGRLW